VASLSGPRGRKRLLLPIGGVVLSELFGTTSKAVLNPIKERIGRLAKGYNYLEKGLRMLRDHFSIFVEFTTKRLDSIRNLTVIQQKAFKEFQDQFQVVPPLTQLTHCITLMFTYLFNGCL